MARRPLADKLPRERRSKSTSSAQGGVTVGGKETKVKRSPTCGYGCNPSAQWGKNWQNVPKGNLRDHRVPRDHHGEADRLAGDKTAGGCRGATLSQHRLA